MKKSCLLIMLSLFMALAFLSTNAMSCTEGCTPGFWKNHNEYKNTDYWCAEFDPDDKYNEVFDSTMFKSPAVLYDVTAGWDNDPTLLDALKCGGGGEKAFARHAVAALLNACSPDVNSWFLADEERGIDYVIEAVQDAYRSENFEWWKEHFEDSNELGCPL